MDETLVIGTAVKALDESGDRIGGYLIVFGDSDHRDLTPFRNADGSVGEWFTKSTYFGLDWPIPMRPALYHHGKDKQVVDECVGVIDHLKADDIGIWAEGQLNVASRYRD